MVVVFVMVLTDTLQIYKTKSPDASVLGNILHKKFRSVQKDLCTFAETHHLSTTIQNQYTPSSI